MIFNYFDSNSFIVFEIIFLACFFLIFKQLTIVYKILFLKIILTIIKFKI